MGINPASSQQVGQGFEVEYNNNPSAFESIAQAMSAYVQGKANKQKTEKAQLAAALPTLLSQGLANPAGKGQQGDMNIAGQGFNMSDGMDMGMTKSGMKNRKSYWDLVNSKKKALRSDVQTIAERLFPKYQAGMEVDKMNRNEAGSGDAMAWNKAVAAAERSANYFGTNNSQGREGSLKSNQVGQDSKQNQQMPQTVILSTNNIVEKKDMYRQLLKKARAQNVSQADFEARIRREYEEAGYAREDIDKIVGI